MPPKKPPLAAARRTVAVGSHQILFSSPIEVGGSGGSHGPRRHDQGGERKERRDKSASRVADYSHVESKVRAQIRSGSNAGRRRSDSSNGLAPAHSSSAGRVLPPSPPPPRDLSYPQSHSRYEEITEEEGAGRVQDSTHDPVSYSSPTAVGVTGERLSAARMTRLLKNARAAVRAPLRPETPLELLLPTTDRAREDFLRGKPASGAAARRGRYGVPGSGDTHRQGTGARLSSLSPSPASFDSSLQSIKHHAQGAQSCGSSPLDRQINALKLESPDAVSSLSLLLTSGSVAMASGGFASPSLSGSGVVGAGASALSADNFLSRFLKAEGQPRQQVTLLKELSRWLMNPNHGIWPACMARFASLLARCNERQSSKDCGESDEAAVGAVTAAIILRNSPLHDEDTAVPLADVVLLLRRLTSTPLDLLSPGSNDTRCGSQESHPQPHHHQQQQQHTAAALVIQWMQQELLFEPLLHLLSVGWVLERHPHIVADTLEVLRNCTKAAQQRAMGKPASAVRAAESSPPLPGQSPLGTRLDKSSSFTSSSGSVEEAGGLSSDGAAASQHLVTLGTIPTLNALTQRLILVYQDSLALRQRNSGHTGEQTTATPMQVREVRPGGVADYLPQLLSTTCLLFRDLSTHFSHHLLRLGTPSLLLSVLEHAGAAGPSGPSSSSLPGSTVVVASAARALARLVFDPACLAAFQQDTRLMTASLAALSTQLSLAESGRRSDQGTGMSLARPGGAVGEDALLHLLVSRLCSVMALVAEGCQVQQRHLAHHGTDVGLALLKRFVSATALTTPRAIVDAHKDGNAEVGDEVAEDGSALAVIQSVVWLVGVTAMCEGEDEEEGLPLAFVEEAATQLTHFLRETALAPHTRLAVIYTLMCLSNLSYFFPVVEKRGDDGAAYLAELYKSLGLVLASVLVDGDVEATVEATRTLGNMSFTNTGRDWMEASKCDEVVLLFLGHEDLRVVYNSFGIVLNLTAGTSCRLVEDGELMRMMLQYTGRFTHRKGISEAAADGHRQFAAVAGTNATKEVAEDYAEQIANLVEKCLANTRGLLEAQQQASHEGGAEVA